MNEPAGVYRTVKSPSTAIYRSKGSKFIAFIFPVKDESSVHSILEKTRAKHPKANHVCYAYIFGKNPIHQYQSDDREPSGSAGLPIQRAIQSADLHNCLLVVVRYFGGTKLGLPGLIQAYKGSALTCIEGAVITEEVFTTKLQVQCGYEYLNELFRITARYNGEIKSQGMEHDPIWVTLELPDSKVPEFIKMVESTYPLSKNLTINKT